MKKLFQRLENVTLSVNCVPYCRLLVTFKSGTGRGGSVMLAMAALGDVCW